MLAAARHIPFYLLKPVRFFRSYELTHLRPDLVAGVTVAVILLPQGIAFALIAELPPQMGLYAAVVAALVGGLWGSCAQNHTGPSNAVSLLVLSGLLLVAEPGTHRFLVAAGLMAVMAGALQLLMGLLRLGVLVNFVSHSVVVGFAAGAGVLIWVKQLGDLLGLQFRARSLLETLAQLASHLGEMNAFAALLGITTILVIVVLRRTSPRLPGALVGMVVSAVGVFVFSLQEQGVEVMGKLPSHLPPLAHLPLFDLDLIAELSTPALAVAAIGLVATTAITRSISAQTGERLDSNQEFVGQGMANIAAGFFSGYPCAGSFSRSAVNLSSGARTAMSSVFSGLFVLGAMFFLAPLAAYLPRAALAGVLIVTAAGMVDQREIRRIFRGARADALILAVTFLGTLFLRMEFAVLAGILLSFVIYILNTSVPRVYAVLPDARFRHLLHQPEKPACPQLGILELWGDLYFGAVTHVETAIHAHMEQNPRERFLLLRMQSVNHCDFSGIHGLESIVRAYRERGGDVFLTRVHEPLVELMRSTGFHASLGPDHFLLEDRAIDHLFHRVLDPAVCIYECPVRAFRECQNLPKPEFVSQMPLHLDLGADPVEEIEPAELWRALRGASPPRVVDVREKREFCRGHIAGAQLVPFSLLEQNLGQLSAGEPLVLVCRGGRRSLRVAELLRRRGCQVRVLKGGMLAWETAGLLEAVE